MRLLLTTADGEINQDREAHGKKPFNGGSGSGTGKLKEVTVSTTDPESGASKKGNINAVLHMGPMRSAINIICFM